MTPEESGAYRFGMWPLSREEHYLAWWTDIKEMKFAMFTLF
jgi:hypothetical protein